MMIPLFGLNFRLNFVATWKGANGNGKTTARGNRGVRARLGRFDELPLAVAGKPPGKTARPAFIYHSTVPHYRTTKESGWLGATN